MSNDRKNLIPKEAYESFTKIIGELSITQRQVIDLLCTEILANHCRYSRMTDFKKPVTEIESLFLRKTRVLNRDEQRALKRGLMAKLALNLPSLVEKMELPPSLNDEYPPALNRFAEFISEYDMNCYDSTNEFFRKDIRFLLGLSFPIGNETGIIRLIDLNSSISFFSVLKSVLKSRRFSEFIKYLKIGGLGRWVHSHIDSRYTIEINQQNTLYFFLRLAEFFKRHIHYKGYVTSSWLWDPALVEISPKIKCLQEMAREGGALFLNLGTEPRDIEMALKKSKTRRRLYQEGKYMPRSFAVIWPRKELLNWADKLGNNSL